MRTNILAILLATTLSFLLGETAQAQSAAEKCDALAANPYDKTNSPDLKPPKFDDIDSDAAIRACSEAVAAQPDVARYHLQLGRGYWKGGKFDQALAEFTIAADAGYWLAKASIGEMYFYGDGRPVDLEKAFAINMEAAEHNISYAAYNAGRWYGNGSGVAKDPVKSLEWFRKAHELGDPDAAVDVGFAYEKGEGTPIDYAEALKWYRIAADKGQAMAMNNIGVFYSNGNAVPRDLDKAMEWFRKAEAKGNALSHINIAEFADQGKAIDVDHALAADYVFKAFELGNKGDDAYNRDAVYEFEWTPDFWREVQTRLKQRGDYDGPIDGQLTEATKDALEKILDK